MKCIYLLSIVFLIASTCVSASDQGQESVTAIAESPNEAKVHVETSGTESQLPQEGKKVEQRHLGFLGSLLLGFLLGSNRGKRSAHETLPASQYAPLQVDLAEHDRQKKAAPDSKFPEKDILKEPLWISRSKRNEDLDA